MPTEAKYRRTYFALVRELGVEQAGVDRHDLNARMGLPRSTRQWHRRDWQHAVAWLQRQAGQHADDQPHVREDRPAVERGGYATWAQCHAIEDLCDRVDWWLGRDDGVSRIARREQGPLAYVCRHHLRGETHAQTRELLVARAAEDRPERGARWRVLPRGVASALIQALAQMAHTYPQEEDDT